MTQVPVTMGRAFRVYWSLLWRCVLLVLLPVALIGSIGAVAYRGELPELAGLPSETVAIAAMLVACVLLLVVPVAIVRRVLSRAWPDFRIVLERPEPRFRIEPRFDQPSPRRPVRHPPPAAPSQTAADGELAPAGRRLSAS